MPTATLNLDRVRALLATALDPASKGAEIETAANAFVRLLRDGGVTTVDVVDTLSRALETSTRRAGPQKRPSDSDASDAFNEAMRQAHAWARAGEATGQEAKRAHREDSARRWRDDPPQADPNYTGDPFYDSAFRSAREQQGRGAYRDSEDDIRRAKASGRNGGMKSTEAPTFFGFGRYQGLSFDTVWLQDPQWFRDRVNAGDLGLSTTDMMRKFLAKMGIFM